MVRLAGFLGTENNYRVDVGIAHSEFLRGENGVGGGRLALRCLTRIRLVTMPLKIEDCAQAPEGFLTDHAEGDRFYESIKAAGLADFDFGYFVIYRDGCVVTIAPYFTMDFRLNTMLPVGRMKRMLAGVKFKLACIGHPCADFGRIHGEVSEETLSWISGALAKKGRLLAFKGFPDALPLSGFVQAVGLPVPVVSLSPTYFSDLKSDRRNLLTRKLKKAATLRYEEHDGVPPAYVDRIFSLYLQTYEKAEVKFELLNREYFLRTCPISKYLLFFEGDHLIGFTQLIGSRDYLINRYIGLDYSRSDPYGLYFAMFIRAVQFGIRENYSTLELGATSYEFKRTLGARLVPTWNYYRHTSPFVHWILGKMKVMLEPSESELK
jgi:hypothetical protein